jgi:hypothetical protein
MTPARLSLRSALLVVVLAAAQLLAVGAVVGGDWGEGRFRSSVWIAVGTTAGYAVLRTREVTPRRF